MIMPALIVVTGRPGAGKTTLAHTLARTIRCPAVCRDEFKEGLLNTYHLSPELSEHANGRVYDAFFHVIELMLRNDVTLVAEAAFQHKRWLPKLEPLQQIAHVRMIICTLEPMLARERVIQRALSEPERANFHGDLLVQVDREKTEDLIVNYDPPRLAVPTLTIDTSQGYQPQIDEIVRFALQPQAR
jgi:predicted kinase